MTSIEAAFQGIWERRYFANNGPLVRLLDAEFAQYVGTRHAVSVVNGFVALMLVLRALAEDVGEMIVPALGGGLTADAVRWSGCSPVFCDVDEAGALDATLARERVTSATRGIVGVRLAGSSFDVEPLEALAAECGVPLILDARESIGGTVNGRRIGSFGRAEVFGFSNARAIDGAGGACITTDDDELALRLRTMRSFHPGETFAPVPVRANGKMSEAQAALALDGLQRLNETVNENRERLRFYEDALSGTGGIRVFRPPLAVTSNAGTVVLGVDDGAAGRLAEQLSRAAIGAATFGEPPHGFPVAARLAGRLLLVTDTGVTSERIAAICELLRRETT